MLTFFRQIEDLPRFVARYIQLASGVLCFLLGVTVIVGWYTHSTTLIQVHTAFAPMQFNTALCFVFFGLGSVFVSLKRWHFVGIFGTLIFVLAALSLTQYLSGLSFGIDQLFIKSYDKTTSYPGRMPPNTALCFTLLGITLLPLGKKKCKLICNSISAVLTSLVMALGVIALVGYLTGLQGTYNWGNMTQMAVHTAFGLAVGSFGLLAKMLGRSVTRKERLPEWSALLVGICGLTVTFSLFLSFKAQEQISIESEVRLKTEDFKTVFETKFQERVGALEHMAARWDERGGTPKAEWEADAALYIQDFEEFQAIGRVDENFKIRQIVPLLGNEAALGYNSATEERRRIALEQAFSSGQTTMTPVVELKQGGSGFLVYVPLIRNEKFDGFIVGVFRVDKVFSSVFSKHFAAQYDLDILEEDKELYSYTNSYYQKQHGQETDIVMLNTKWRARITPLPQTLTTMQSNVPKIALYLGFAFSLLLSLTVYLMQRSREQSSLLKDSKKRLSGIVETAMDAIIILDSSFKVILFNAAAEKMFCCKAEEAIGQTLDRFIPEKHRSVHQAHIEKFAQSKDTSRMMNGIRRTKGLRSTGEEFSLEVSIAKMDTLEQTLYTAILRDVTNRVKMENDLEEARDAAIESARLKAEFLANMSHEIRTPMNGVIGMTNFLLDTDLDKEQKEFVEIVRASGESLLTIINDILDFSKIDAGKFNFETIDFDLQDVVEKTVEMFATQISDKSIELNSIVHSNVPSGLQGDPGRIRQVLTNLIGNAIKFTSKGKVSVRVTLVEETETHAEVKVSVSDTGIGIKPDALANLFQPFTQADGSTTRKYGGTGLGLTICKRLVEMMNGEIKIESDFGKGSTFSFTVRLEKQTSVLQVPVINSKQVVHATQMLSVATVEPTKQIQHADGESPRLLIAEDNEVNQKVIARMIKKLGFEADLVANGAEALEALNRQRYALVLMDCQMPEVDGYQATMEIRKRNGYQTMPIIALTANVMQGEKEKCLAVGMSDYLTKPVKHTELVAMLDKWTMKEEVVSLSVQT